jgi:hypothetical protein
VASWGAGTTFSDAQEIQLGGGVKAVVYATTSNGLILYEVVPSQNSPTPIPIAIPVTIEEVTTQSFAAEIRLSAAAADAEITEAAGSAVLLE